MSPRCATHRWTACSQGRLRRRLRQPGLIPAINFVPTRQPLLIDDAPCTGLRGPRRLCGTKSNQRVRLSSILTAASRRATQSTLISADICQCARQSGSHCARPSFFRRHVMQSFRIPGQSGLCGPHVVPPRARYHVCYACILATVDILASMHSVARRAIPPIVSLFLPTTIHVDIVLVQKLVNRPDS